MKHQAWKAMVCMAVVLDGLAPGALGASATATTVSKASTVELGSIGFGSMIVDDKHHHVFVSGSKANEVIVTDFNGTIVKTLTNEGGATGMAINRSTLYVADTSSGAVDQINLASLTDKGVLATGLPGVRWPAVAGGKLWTAFGPPYSSDQLASVGFQGTVSKFEGSYYNAEVASSLATPDALYVATDSLSPGSVYRFDVSTGKPVLQVSATTDDWNIEEVAVSPDGTRVIPASGAPYEFQELAASTLQPDGVVYPGQPYPSAVAVAPRRRGLLATGLENGYSSPDIQVFKIGDTSAKFSASTTTSNGTANVMPHGLALASKGSRLFAVTADDVYDSSFTLHVFRKVRRN